MDSVIQNRIISDEESAETLHYMVRAAIEVLRADNSYPIFINMISELVESLETNDNFLHSSFLCGVDDFDDDKVKERGTMVDKLTIELLRFLAMKVLLSDGINSYDENEGRNDKNRNANLRLNPSSIIRESWNILMLLPLAYRHICKTFCVDVIDCNDDELLGEKSSSSWGLKSYYWTIDVYTNLYMSPPTKTFWPDSGKLVQR